MSTRTVHDPFHGKDVQISDKLTDRLRGKYACGPMLPSGEPEFGWRQMPEIPIQVAAADRIDELEKALRKINALIDSPARFNPDVQAVLDSVIDTSDKKFEKT